MVLIHFLLGRVARACGPVMYDFTAIHYIVW